MTVIIFGFGLMFVITLVLMYFAVKSCGPDGNNAGAGLNRYEIGALFSGVTLAFVGFGLIAYMSYSQLTPAGIFQPAQVAREPTAIERQLDEVIVLMERIDAKLDLVDPLQAEGAEGEGEGK